VDHIELYDPDGIKSASGREWITLVYVHLVERDDIFIGDAGWNVVEHFDATGTLLSPRRTTALGIWRLARTQHRVTLTYLVLDDLVYVVDRRECRIEGYNVTGENRATLGTSLAPRSKTLPGRNNPSQMP